MNLTVPLCRAKAKSHNKWLYGFFFYSQMFDEPCIQQINDHVTRLVNPETVSLCSGIYDCKRTDEYPAGQPICEGDIIDLYCINKVVYYSRVVDAKNMRTMLVTYDGCSFGMKELYRGYTIPSLNISSRKDYSHRDEYINGLHLSDFSIEVIGNKWDDPCLLFQ